MSFQDDAQIDSSRVQRRRGATPGLIAGGSIGSVGLMLVLFLASQWLGVDLTSLGPVIMDNQPQSSQEKQLTFDECKTGADANKDDECRMAAAANALDAYWERHVDGYTKPEVVLYRGATQSACGPASNQTGPFYCPKDQTVYIDTEFYKILKSEFGAQGGPLSQMYVLAHEWGHHIQNITGQLDQSDRSTGAGSRLVRTELQADCYAGAWIKDASTVKDRNGRTFLKPITPEQRRDALNAAASVGDDHIQQRSGHEIHQDSFTHGSSEQRQRWLTIGSEKGPTSCNTYDVPADQL